MTAVRTAGLNTCFLWNFLWNMGELQPNNSIGLTPPIDFYTNSAELQTWESIFLLLTRGIRSRAIGPVTSIESPAPNSWPKA